MTHPLATLRQARLLATGSQMDVEVPSLAPRCNTDAEFVTIVTDYYKFFNENLSGDVSFLLRCQPSRDIEALRRLIYNLRTASNHADNAAAKDAADRWRSQYKTPQDAATALATALRSGLETLAKIAVAVSRSGSDAARWRDILSIDTTTVFSSVAADLGLMFTEGNRRRMVRNVEKRLEVRPVLGDRRVVVAEYCVQEIVSDRRPLPVPYDQVLDRLQLLGKAGSTGAVLVAHSVAEISPGLVGDAFLDRVERTWRQAAAG